MVDIDEIDRKIIGLLIEDSRRKLKDIAHICGISSTAVQNRIRKLEQNGIIVKYTWSIDWSFFGYYIPVTICVNLEPKRERDIYRLLKKKVVVMGIDHFLGVCDLSIFAVAKSIEELKELEWSLRKQKNVNEVNLFIWNIQNMKMFNFAERKHKQWSMDSIDVKIFKKLLEKPRKSFLKIANEIGIAPITVQKRYKKMEKIGFLKPSAVIDYSKMGQPLKACFLIAHSNVMNKDLIFRTIKKTPNIFLFAETIGSFDFIAMGLFKDLNDVKRINRKFRTLPSVNRVVCSITNRADFPYQRGYNPSQIFELENLESLK